jgi:hypothetical protein
MTCLRHVVPSTSWPALCKTRRYEKSRNFLHNLKKLSMRKRLFLYMTTLVHMWRAHASWRKQWHMEPTSRMYHPAGSSCTPSDSYLKVPLSNLVRHNNYNNGGFPRFLHVSLRNYGSTAPFHTVSNSSFINRLISPSELLTVVKHQ